MKNPNLVKRKNDFYKVGLTKESAPQKCETLQKAYAGSIQLDNSFWISFRTREDSISFPGFGSPNAADFFFSQKR